MKAIIKNSFRAIVIGIASLLTLSSGNLFAQDSAAVEKVSFGTGIDFYNRYVWRGSKFGDGPSMQPGLFMQAGGFKLGYWGAFQLSDSLAPEADIYASYSFPFGLGLTVTDYYFYGSSYFDYDEATTSHGIEGSASFTLSEDIPLTLTAGVFFYGDTEYSKYGEIAYDFGKAKLFVGAGDGDYTTDQEFNICNVGVSTSKELKFSDSFSMAVNGSVVLNPNKEAIFILVGFSL